MRRSGPGLERAWNGGVEVHQLPHRVLEHGDLFGTEAPLHEPVELRQDGFEPMREDIQMTTTGTSTFMMRRAGEQP